LGENIAFKLLDVGRDLLKQPWRLVTIEVADQRDLITDLGFALVDPRVGNVRQDFALEVFLDAFFQRHRLGVAQFGIGFRVAVAVAADFRCLVALPEGVENRFEFRGG
jgi:hypothetical protein